MYLKDVKVFVLPFIIGPVFTLVVFANFVFSDSFEVGITIIVSFCCHRFPSFSLVLTIKDLTPLISTTYLPSLNNLLFVPRQSTL